MPSDESIERGTTGPVDMLCQLCTSAGGGEAKGMVKISISKNKKKRYFQFKPDP